LIKQFHIPFDLVVVASGLAAGAGTATVHWWRTRHSSTWPTIASSVVSGQVRPEGYHYAVEIYYSYSVNGEYYSGVLRHTARTRKRAEEFSRKFPPGAFLRVRFNPSRPDVSHANLHDQPFLG